MRFLVFGTGAVGGLLGGKLALSGRPVTFLARKPVAEAMRDRGLRIGGTGRQSWIEKPDVFTDVDEAFSHAQPDVVLITVKAYDCQQVAETLKRVTPKPTAVVSFLNGISNEATLSRYLGPERVIPATLTTAVQMPEPGELSIERERGLGIGSGHPLASPLKDELTKAGFAVWLYPDSDRMKWSKLLTNIVSNASSAILGWSPSEVFNHQDLYRLEVEALREAVRIMRKLGFKPQNLPGIPVGLLGWGIFLPSFLLQIPLRRIVAAGRGEKLPSFHHDIGRGRSEVIWLNGAIVREGQRFGIPTPANQVLTDTLMALVGGEEEIQHFLNQPEVLITRAIEAGVPGLG